MPTQTFEITAPNGKTLEITGDHVPTEAELKDIFAKAGVETKTPTIPAAPEAQRRSRTGQLYTPAPASGELKEFAQAFGRGISPANVAGGLAQLVGTAVSDPYAAGQMMVEGVTQPIRTAAGGNIPKALGEGLSMTVVGNLLGKLPAAARGTTLSKAVAIAKMTKSPLASVVSALVPRVLEQLKTAGPEEAGAASMATPAVEPTPPAATPAPPTAIMPNAAVRPGPRTINEAMEEAIAKARAPKSAPAAPAAASPVKATSDLLTSATSSKLKLTAAEVKTGADLIRAGKSPKEALDAIQAMRTFAQKFNLLASAEVKAVVQERNASGEWGEKK